MSLQHIANTMKAQGRGPDDMLVHMSSREVAGLQGLAKAAGGSLTVNPTTGLPEAGFLDSLLPTILGAGATFFGGPMAGAAVGALTGAVQNKENPLLGAITGGLGGYGGGQMLSGLNSLGAAGANAATDATMNVVGGANIPEVVAQQAAQQAAPMTMQNLAAGASKAFDTPSAYMQALGGASGAIGAGTKALAPMSLYVPTADGGVAPVGEIPKYRVSRQYTGGIGAPNSPYTSERSWYSGPTFEKAYATGGDVAAAPAPAPADVAAGMTGASADAFRYLMGQSPAPQAQQVAPTVPLTNMTSYTSGLAALPAAATAATPSSYSPTTAGTAAATSGLGQGVNATATDIGLTLMTNPITAPLGRYIAGQQLDAMGNASNALSNAQSVGGIGTVSDANGNVISYSNPATIAAYDAATFGPAPAPAPVYQSSYSPSSYSSSIGSVGNSDTMSSGGGYFAAGGPVMGLESGGFVIPADVVSAVGNGSSAAGLEILAQQMGAVPVDGEGDGQSDSIPTTIDGKHPAAVAREEAYLGPQEVARMGGASKLYALMDRIRMQAHGSTEQQRPVV